MAEFSQEVIRIINRKDKTIQTAEQRLFDKLDPTNQRVFAAVKKLVNEMNVTGGKIEFDDQNIDIASQIDKTIVQAIQSSDMPSAIAEYLRDFETIKKFNFDVHKDVNDLSEKELEDLISPVQKTAVQNTLDGLTGSGVNANFVEPVRQGLFQNIAAGTTKSDLEAYLTNYILGNPNVDGLYSRYVKQVSRDALNQFDGQVNSRIAEEFDLDAFRYVGSLIDDSRAQCIRWVKKRILQKSDLESEIGWASNNGSGMIAGTNAENFAVFRGGYNCRHSAIPFKLTASQKKRLDNPEEQQKEEEKIVEETGIVGTVPAAKDFPDLYTYKSKLTPPALKGVAGVSEYIYELSDNGNYKNTDKKGAYYDQFAKFVNVPESNSRYSTKYALSKVVVHEFGHRTHFEQKYFRNAASHDPEHENIFLESKKIVKNNFDQSTNWSSLVNKYSDKFKDQYQRSEIQEMVASYADTIEALTAGRFGYGHGKRYMTDDFGSYARFEWFAHAAENYFVSNPVFELEFPELHEQMLKYFRELVVKPKFPNIK